jgi:NitT/TauT family transport system substrate-binding protein
MKVLRGRIGSCHHLLRTVFVAGTLLAVATGCSSTDSAPGSSGNLPIKVGTYPGSWLEIPTYVAKEKGFFADNGLEAELITNNSGPVMVAAAAAGSIDTFPFTPNATMVANSQGYEFKQIAATKSGPIYDVLGSKKVMEACPHAGRPYPEPIQCMKGKKLSINALGSDNYNVALTLLKDAGLSEKDLSIVPISTTGGMMTALQQGQTDFVISIQPAAAQLVDVERVATRIVSLAKDSNQYFSNWPGYGSFAIKHSIDSAPDKYRRFADSLDAAVGWIIDPRNKEELAEIFMKYAPNIQRESALVLAQNAPGSFDTQLTCSAVENASKWLQETGQLSREESVKCEDFVWSNALKESKGTK